MKKLLSALICAGVIFSVTGCGDAASTADNVKKEVAEEVRETASDVKEVASKVEQKASSVGNNAISEDKFALGGITPGMTFDEVKKILGEPVSRLDDDEYVFSNGLTVEVQKHNNIVEELKTYDPGVSANGISVGKTEQDLINAYGQADKVDRDHDKIEYKYYSSNRRLKIEFELVNGEITEIKSALSD